MKCVKNISNENHEKWQNCLFRIKEFNQNCSRKKAFCFNETAPLFNQRRFGQARCAVGG